VSSEARRSTCRDRSATVLAAVALATVDDGVPRSPPASAASPGPSASVSPEELSDPSMQLKVERAVLDLIESAPHAGELQAA